MLKGASVSMTLDVIHYGIWARIEKESKLHIYNDTYSLHIKQDVVSLNLCQDRLQNAPNTLQVSCGVILEKVVMYLIGTDEVGWHKLLFIFYVIHQTFIHPL